MAMSEYTNFSLQINNSKIQSYENSPEVSAKTDVHQCSLD